MPNLNFASKLHYSISKIKRWPRLKSHSWFLSYVFHLKFFFSFSCLTLLNSLFCWCFSIFKDSCREKKKQKQITPSLDREVRWDEVGAACFFSLFSHISLSLLFFFFLISLYLSLFWFLFVFRLSFSVFSSPI